MGASYLTRLQGGERGVVVVFDIVWVGDVVDVVVEKVAVEFGGGGFGVRSGFFTWWCWWRGGFGGFAFIGRDGIGWV